MSSTVPDENVPTYAEVLDFHTNADTDINLRSIHHTLGKEQNQATPGQHKHTGSDSVKLGAGLGLTVTGSRAGNAALLSLINMLKATGAIDFIDSTTP